MATFKANDIVSSATIGFISRICTIAIRFISLPLILTLISKERYGLWLIIISIIGWFGMSDLGIPSALQNHIINLRSTNKTAQSHAVVSYAIKFLTIIGFSVLVVTSIFLIFAPITAWFSISKNLELEFKFAILICIFGFSVGLPARLGGVIFNVHGQLSFQPLLEIANNVLTLLLLFIAIKLNWDSLVSLAFINVVGSLMGGIIMTLASLRVYNYRIISKKINLTDRKALISKGGFFYITTIGELLILQSDALLIAYTISADKVAIYLIPATIFINFLQLQNIWLRPLWPILTMLYVKNDFESIYRRLKQALSGTILLAIFFGFGIILFGDTFIRYWSHGLVGMSSIMAWGFAIYILIASLDNLIATFLSSFNKIELRFFYTLILGISKVVVGWQILLRGEMYIDWLPIGYSIAMGITSVPIAALTLNKVLQRMKLKVIN